MARLSVSPGPSFSNQQPLQSHQTVQAAAAAASTKQFLPPVIRESTESPLKAGAVESSYSSSVGGSASAAAAAALVQQSKITGTHQTQISLHLLCITTMQFFTRFRCQLLMIWLFRTHH